MVKYIKVEWPEYQIFMDHPRFKECYYTQATDKELSSSLMVPEDLYNESLAPRYWHLLYIEFEDESQVCAQWNKSLKDIIKYFEFSLDRVNDLNLDKASNEELAKCFFDLFGYAEDYHSQYELYYTEPITGLIKRGWPSDAEVASIIKEIWRE